MKTTTLLALSLLALAGGAPAARASELSLTADIMRLADVAPHEMHDTVLLEQSAKLRTVLGFRRLIEVAHARETKVRLVESAMPYLKDVTDAQNLAGASPDSALHDRVLVEGARICDSGFDFTNLVKVAHGDEAKIHLIRGALDLADDMLDITSLASLSPRSFRDEVLLRGVPFCESTHDLERLLDAAVNPEARKKLVELYGKRETFQEKNRGWW